MSELRADLDPNGFQTIDAPYLLLKNQTNSNSCAADLSDILPVFVKGFAGSTICISGHTSVPTIFSLAELQQKVFVVVSTREQATRLANATSNLSNVLILCGAIDTSTWKKPPDLFVSYTSTPADDTAYAIFSTKTQIRALIEKDFVRSDMARGLVQEMESPFFNYTRSGFLNFHSEKNISCPFLGVFTSKDRRVESERNEHE